MFLLRNHSYLLIYCIATHNVAHRTCVYIRNTSRFINADIQRWLHDFFGNQLNQHYLVKFSLCVYNFDIVIYRSQNKQKLVLLSCFWNSCSWFNLLTWFMFLFFCSQIWRNKKVYSISTAVMFSFKNWRFCYFLRFQYHIILWFRVQSIQCRLHCLVAF